MKKFKVGLQLYSIRDEMEKSVDDALRQVKEIGYDCVEFAGYFGHTAEELKGMLDKYGLECISVHQGPTLIAEEGQKAVDFMKALGAKYAAVPWYDKELHAGTEHWEETVKLFNSNGKLLKDNGIQQLYHNHDFEFETFNGKFLLDWIYETIPADYMQPEVDTCWVHYAGYDPSEYLLKYSGRIDIVHLKDFEAKRLGGGPAYALIDNEGNEIETERGDIGFRFRPVGYGRQNIPAIIEAAKKAGATCFIVEQDEWYDGSSIQDAKTSREYLKSLGL